MRLFDVKKYDVEPENNVPQEVYGIPKDILKSFHDTNPDNEKEPMPMEETDDDLKELEDMDSQILYESLKEMTDGDFDHCSDFKNGKIQMLFASPIFCYSYIQKIPSGKLVTMDQMKNNLDKEIYSVFQNPMPIEFSIGIAAWASYHHPEVAMLPYWRVLKSNGELNPSIPGGVLSQKRFLEKEGHTVVSKGTETVTYYVMDYEKNLFE